MSTKVFVCTAKPAPSPTIEPRPRSHFRAKAFWGFCALSLVTLSGLGAVLALIMQ